MPQRNYSSISSRDVTLKSDITATATSVVVTRAEPNGNNMPGPHYIAALGRGTPNEELVLVTSNVGDAVAGTVTHDVTRAYDGTTAKVHRAGTKFEHVTSAIDFRDRPHVDNGVLDVGTAAVYARSTNKPAFRFGPRGGLQGVGDPGDGSFVTDALYHDGTNWRYSETSTTPVGRLRVSGNLLLWGNAPAGAKDALATVTDRLLAAETETRLGPWTGANGAWDRAVFKHTTLWGDGVTTAAEDGGGANAYVTLGAGGGVGGIMLARPHVVWTGAKLTQAEALAEVRYGRVGGVSSGAWWGVGVGRNRAGAGGNDTFSIWRAGVGTSMTVHSDRVTTFNRSVLINGRDDDGLIVDYDPAWERYGFMKYGGRHGGLAKLGGQRMTMHTITGGTLRAPTAVREDWHWNDNGDVEFLRQVFGGNVHDNGRRVMVKGQVDTVNREHNNTHFDGGSSTTALNRHFSTGWYNCVNANNNPWGDTRWFFMLVQSHVSGSHWQRQIVWDMTGGTTASYSRRCSGGDPNVATSWSGWVHMGG